jgi:uncharacterized protein YtpQ (UPF0354 family)
MLTVDQIFCSELDKRGLKYSVMPEGVYEFRINEQMVTVSLENIRRNYDRDGDPDAITQFVEKLTTEFLSETPPWDDVRPYIRYSLEPSDYGTFFDGVLFDRINDELNQVFVFTPADGSRITWIDESMLGDWSITRQEVLQQAEENMSAIIAKTNLEVEEIDGNKLGMISTEETPFKASLILSPAFRELVSPSHGWPVYVVVPCRDFVYVIRKNDHEFLSRLGGVVIKEYRNSGHPITKDVLEISDNGIAAIGSYPEPE